MKNITLSIEDDVLGRVRVYAAKNNTTVNRLVREYLQQLARREERSENAREKLLELIDKSPGRLGPDWKWNREEIYEGRVLPRHERPPVRGAGKNR